MAHKAEKEFEALIDTFMTDGYKIIMEDTANMIDAFKEALTVTTDNNQFHFIRGQIEVLRRYQNYEHVTRAIIEAQEAESDEEEDIE